MEAARPRRLLGRDFVLLWQGQLVSQVGNQAFLVATMSWTLDATGSPGLMGLLLVCSTLPPIAFGPIAGAIADRHSRRTLIVLADLLRGLGHLALAGVLAVAPDATGAIVPLLLVLGFLSGVLGALLTPALTAAIPDLVPAEKLATANALHQVSSQTATLVGQAMGGLAYTWIGAAGLVSFDGVTFVLSAGCAALARVPQPPPRREAALGGHASGYLRDVREGAEWVWRRPSLRSLILAFAGVNFLFTPVFVLLPVYVKDVLGRGPEWYGFLLAGAGGGAMVGAALAPLARKAAGGLAGWLLGVGVCTVALGLSRSAPVALALLAAVGVLSGMVNVRVMTSLQASTPAELRGRVVAVTVALAGAAVPVGLGLGGLLGGLARPALASLVVGCGAGIVGVAVLFGRNQWRTGLRPEDA